MIEMVSEWSGMRHYVGGRGEGLDIVPDGGGRGGRMGCTPRV